MVHEFNPAHDDSNYTLSTAQLDLLAALLSQEDVVYPWNPEDLEATAYFAEQEQHLQAALSEPEITAKSQEFHAQLEQLWSKFTPKAHNSCSVPNHCLQARLQQQFATYVPSPWLNAIAHQVKYVSTTQNSLTEKLVQCVAGLIPSLTKEDLLVLARPFADTTKQTTIEPEAVIIDADKSDWTNLSTIEQAQASFAVARYALAQLAE